MNEIDINIEGFNVNGICVGCLNYNRKMFYSQNVIECFRILADIEVPDGLSVQVCWECLAMVNKVYKFQNQIRNSYSLLLDYSKKNKYLDSPEDLSCHSQQNLSIQNDLITLYQLYNETEVEFEDTPPEVKEEIEPDLVKSEDTDKDDEVKDEPDTYDAAFDYSHDSEEDNIHLSQLSATKKKSKRDRKLSKRRKHGLNRKWKDIPQDMVESRNTSEEEMWHLKMRDLKSEYFSDVRFKCADCVVGFHSLKQEQEHLVKYHSQNDGSYLCDVCHAYFLCKDDLTVHRFSHTIAYRCKMCGFETAIKKGMVAHLNKLHDVGDTWKCHLCTKIFSTKNKLMYHKAKCNQEKPQCDCCGKVFANKITLKCHLKSPSIKVEEKPKENTFIQCKGCDKMFPSKKSYRAHVVIHDGLEYPCPECGKLFQWKRNLARHLRNHTEKATGQFYECRPCRKRFSSKDCFNNHMKFSKKHVTSDHFSHECSYCGKKFATKWCLVDHEDWDHLKKIKYQCPTCLKPFKTAKIMVAHVNNIHKKKNIEPEGEHLCEICGKSYKTEKRLKGHVWAMHTHRSTTKSFKCTLCPATFTWQTSIYKHMKMMHDNPKKAKPTRAVRLRNEQNAYDGVDIATRVQYFQDSVLGL